jgi:predicted N-acetyltransferase YhbS
MRIVSLIDELDLLPPLAQLHHDEWSHVSPFKTVGQHLTKLRSRIGRDPIPATFVVAVDREVVGSVSLLKRDDIDDVRPDLTPWLASLMVAPGHRSRGLGRALVQHCIDQARLLGYPALFLYTDSHAAYYSRLGWLTMEQRLSRGADVTVMQFLLTNSPSAGLTRQ